MTWPAVASVALAALGALLLWRAAAARRESSGQTWPSDSQQHVDGVLLTLPGAGLWAVLGAVALWPGVPRDVAAVAGTVLFLPGAVMILTAVLWRTPLWWVPRWAREQVRHRRQVGTRNRRRRKPA